VYAGCHGYAIPRRCRDVAAAAELVSFLTSAETARLEAARGVVPARADVEVPQESERDRRRARLLAETIERDMLAFPPLASYPKIEEACAGALRAALQGRIDGPAALARMQAAAELATATADAVALH
jgi:ABC-type glycerol-3-phosphate transport system substrate-binding protein